MIFNKTNYQTQFNGDNELEKKHIELFLKFAAIDFINICKAFEENNINDLFRFCHIMKTKTKYISAIELNEYLTILEENSERRNKEVLSINNKEQFEKLYHSLIKEINKNYS